MGPSLLKSSIWLFAGQGSSLIFQAVYFICLGRLLGSREYGIYVGAAALVAIVSQYSALGSHSVFLRYVSPDHKLFAPYWGNILITTVSLGTVFAALISAYGPMIAHSYSHGLLACIAISDCLCGQITLAAARVFLAFDKARITAMLNLLTNGLRSLLAGILLWRVQHIEARQWVFATLAVSLIGACTAVLLVTAQHGRPQFLPRLLRKRSGEGFVFALSYSTSGIYNDIDKAMLGHYGMNIANGVYAMAYRVVDVCMMPISSLHQAAFPRFFRKGVAGIAETRPYALKILTRTAPVSIGLALLMAATAPLIPHFVGRSFAESTFALWWLCTLPFLRSFHLSAGDALTGAGFQKLRLSTQAFAAFFNLSVNVYLIPHYGWHGAAWSSLITDGMLGALNWTVLLSVRRRVVNAAVETTGVRA